MLPLPAGELVRMRTELEQTLPGTAVIQTAVRASDGQGGQSWTYAASGTVSARLSPESLRSDEAIVGSRTAEVSPWILTVPQATTIDEDDRVVYDSVTYEVSEVLTRIPWEISRRVRCVEVD